MLSWTRGFAIERFFRRRTRDGARTAATYCGAAGSWQGVTFVLRHPTMSVGALLLAVVAIAAFAAPLLGTMDPQAVSPAHRLRPPSADHWFGTDSLGRDLYSRVIYGARTSLIVALAVAAIATTTGVFLGLVSGFVRWLDPIVMRIIDGLMAIPSVLIAIALLGVARGSILNVIIAISLAEFPRVARLMRGLVLSTREEPYVLAAVACGSNAPKIMARHILPNVIDPIVVQGTFIGASAIVTEAILSFIGVGTPPSIPSWGNIMAEGRALWEVKPFIVFFPSVFLCVCVLAVNLLGDGLRDMLDPRMARRL
jgi:peptide/nickel transport system permease protein